MENPTEISKATSVPTPPTLWRLCAALPCLAAAAALPAPVSAPMLASASGGSPDTLTFAVLWDKVLAAHPFTALNQASLEEAEAAVRRAALPERPRVSLETEEFLGTGPYAGGDAAASTGMLEMEWEAFGQRAARREAAAAQGAAVRADGLLRAAEWRAETLRRMEKAYWAGRHTEIAEKRMRLADSLARTLEERRRLGGTSAADVARARLEASAARRQWRAQQEEEASRRAVLAALWGDSALTGALADPLADRGADANNGFNGVWEDVRQARSRAADREAEALDREAWPKLALSAGYRRFWSEGKGAWVAGVSVPLPFWNPAGAEAAAARARGRQLAAEAATVRREAAAEADHWERQARLAAQEAEGIREHELPLAEELWGQVEAGFRQGRYGLTDLLFAAEERLDLREAWWESEGRFREASIEGICLREKYGARSARSGRSPAPTGADTNSAGDGGDDMDDLKVEEDQP